MDIKEIIKKYKSGKLNNGLDESYTGGFWDLAGEIIRKHIDMETMPIIDELQDEIYSALTELYREMK